MKAYIMPADMTRTSGSMKIRRWYTEYRNNVLIHSARAAANEIANRVRRLCTCTVHVVQGMATKDKALAGLFTGTRRIGERFQL